MIIISRHLKYFFISFLILLSACAVNPVTGKQELMLVSENQEKKIGKQAAPSMKWEFGGRYHDPALETYLSAIVNRIWQRSERPHLPVTFYIQNTSIPNAFALPGHVAITRGLLSDLDNEAQFAAIIGHETGHVMARHTAQRLSRITMQQMGLAIGGVVLEGTGGADILLTAGSIGSQLYLLKYSREQEIQADRLGVKYMALLGYDPHEALDAHEVLGKSVETYMERIGGKRSEDTFMSNLLSTHPRKKVRLNEIQDMIEDLPGYSLKGDGVFRDRFHEKIKKIKQTNKVYLIYDEAEKFYKEKKYTAAEQRLDKAISLNSSQAPFYNLLGFVKAQQVNYQGAERLFRKALSIDSEFQPSVYGLGLVFFLREQYKSAIPHLKKSLNLYPDHTASHLALGKSYFILKQYRQAMPYLSTVSQVLGKHPEIHGLMGICYEKIEEKGLAVKEYRYQLQVAPQNELGLHARERLAVLEPTFEN
jgi:predicted Zn-dependent protease